MNQLFLEIAKQAGLKFPSETALSPMEEKFAELLIQECINIAYEYDKPKLSGPGLAIASNIESHFDIYIEEDGRFVK
jgi:hypothetical protein